MPTPTQRIQKVLAAAGFGSRRACELLVEQGRVTVNGRKVLDLPVLVDPDKDRICVDRKAIRSAKLVYYLLNKPPGYYCTNTDPDGRPRAVDLMTGVRTRVFPVGRLDAGSMGLLIMTNDGALTQKLTHPSFQAPKTYRAEITGRPTPEALVKFRKGVWLSEGRTAPAEIKIIHRQKDKTIVEITLREGHNREIRRVIAKLGHKVRRLTRIRMGKLSTRRLPLGAYRPLTLAEVRYLQKLADQSRQPPRQRARPAAGSRIVSKKRRTTPVKPAIKKKSPARTMAGTTTKKRRIIHPAD